MELINTVLFEQNSLAYFQKFDIKKTTLENRGNGLHIIIEREENNMGIYEHSIKLDDEQSKRLLEFLRLEKGTLNFKKD